MLGVIAECRELWIVEVGKGALASPDAYELGLFRSDLVCIRVQRRNVAIVEMMNVLSSAEAYVLRLLGIDASRLHEREQGQINQCRQNC
jgi:hypothetical protein